MRTLLRPRRQLMWTPMGRRCGTMRLGTRGGSRVLGGGTCLAVIVLCGGTLRSDMAVGVFFLQFIDSMDVPVITQRRVRVF